MDQCEARTRKGLQCKKDAIKGSKFCHISSHQKQGAGAQGKSIFQLLMKGLGTIITVTATILGIAATVITFSSSIEITTDSKIDFEDDFSTPFSIKNISLLPIYDLSISCFLNEVKVIVERERYRNYEHIFAVQPPVKKMKVQESHSLPCRLPTQSEPGTVEILSADIQVLLEYKNFFKIPETHDSRFCGFKDSNGKLRWIPLAEAAKFYPYCLKAGKNLSKNGSKGEARMKGYSGE